MKYKAKLTYDKEDFTTDCDWLNGMEVVDIKEIKPWLRGIITKGFLMSKKEYVEFMEATK
jgi:hypothetical protein